jgi:hypothetical protein
MNKKLRFYPRLSVFVCAVANVFPNYSSAAVKENNFGPGK